MWYIYQILFIFVLEIVTQIVESKRKNLQYFRIWIHCCKKKWNMRNFYTNEQIIRYIGDTILKLKFWNFENAQ